MSLFEVLHSLSDTIITFGYLGIFAAIFAESGLLIGFFLPGDSLLFTLGLLASQDVFNITILIPLVMAAAILGDSFGYAFGKVSGDKFFNRPDSRFFKKEYVTKTEEFYLKHGKRTIILARFIPIVRTFAPILAGAGHMHYPTFLTYNIIGASIWGGGVTLVGYVLGSQFPEIKNYLEYIIIGIILTSFIPIVIEYYKNKKQKSL